MMRTLKNTQAYTRGAIAMSILAGWTPSHRSIEVEAAEMGDVQERDNAARVTFACNAVRNVVVAALLVVGVSATSPARAAEPVSPIMQGLISDFSLASLRQGALDTSGDTEKAAAAAQERNKALIALAFHEPANLTELGAKTAALVEFTEDTERFFLRILVEDTNKLAQVAK